MDGRSDVCSSLLAMEESERSRKKLLVQWPRSKDPRSLAGFLISRAAGGVRGNPMRTKAGDFPRWL